MPKTAKTIKYSICNQIKKEQWQLYDEQGHPLVNSGADRYEVFEKGLLHGASHVWIYRFGADGIEIMVQQRAPTKQTWPDLYDISAAGHIDLGEDPIDAALRETDEELTLQVSSSELKLYGVQRTNLIAPNGYIENEFQWLYLHQLKSAKDIVLQKMEISGMRWEKLEDFKNEVLKHNHRYVPQGKVYFLTLIAALENEFNSAGQNN